MTRHGAQLGDLLLPIAVIAVVGMMIFPLPLPLLDLLLMMNISLAVVLLLSSVYLAEPERFTSLPTILLLSTLFRLGLNISTTRQLLSNGTAPEVVIAFGDFVVSGNIVVGVVVFSIVTLVQFLVIAKGAERVAEVAARFTLDAMPGKQMSIDADIRAGILSLQEAREKRRELTRESKLYGALDGAMKFVKGDAVAGLLITAINIGAGFVLGVLQQGMSLANAAHKYTLFTIGDGLVSQIPALLTAVSAGIAVTRVGDREGSYVGRELFIQLTREPQAIAATGVVLLCLSLTPGLPFFPFALMGVVFLVAASNFQRSRARTKENEAKEDFRPKVFAGMALRLSPRAAALLQQERSLPGTVQNLRHEIFESTGILVPDIQFDICADSNEAVVHIVFRSVRLGEVSLPSGANGLRLSDLVTLELRRILSENLHELLDDTQTRMLMELHQAYCEDLIHSVVPKLISVTELSAILRELVAESVSVKDFAGILQAIAEFQTAVEPVQNSIGTKLAPAIKRAGGERRGALDLRLLRYVRSALKRVISRGVANDQWEVSAWLVSADLDRLLSQVELSGMTLHPKVIEQIQECARKLEHSTERKMVLFLGTEHAREILSRILRKHRSVRVLSSEELSDEVRLTILGEFALPSQGERGGFESNTLPQQEGEDSSTAERRVEARG